MNGFIEIVSGTLGGGKTSKAVEVLYDHLWRGGWAYTNIEMYPEAIAARMAEGGRVFEPERLVHLTGDARKFHEQVKRGTDTCNVMVVIDEAGLEINARDWKDTDKLQLAFNTMARKLNIHLVYISQDVNDVDKQLRRKAEIVWVCRNMKKLRIWGVIPCPLPFYFRVRFNNTLGAKPQKMDSEIVLRSPAWGLFNSNAMVGNVAQVFKTMDAVEATPLKRIARTAKPAKNGRLLLPFTSFVSCASFYLFS